MHPTDTVTCMLETERLRLRRPTVDDVDALFLIHSDPRTYAHAPELAMSSRKDAMSLFLSWDASWNEDGCGYFIVEQLTGTVIGCCGLRHSALGGQLVLNTYYRFIPEFHGHGYAREAVAAAIDWTRRRHPSLPIVAVVAPSNARSRRLAERLGFVENSITDTPLPVETEELMFPNDIVYRLPAA